MTLPGPVTYCTVNWNTAVFIPARTVQGKVYFTPEDTTGSLKGVALSPGSNPKVTILLPTESIDLVNGDLSIQLIATDNASVNPVGWQYRVSFDLTDDLDNEIAIDSFLINAPGGTTQDLTDLFALVVDPTTGQIITKGLKGDVGLFSGAETLVVLGAVSGNVNIDLSLGSAFSLTLTGATTLNFINEQLGKVNYATLRVTQDANGSRTLDVVGRQGSFGANALANLSATPSATDEVICSTWDNGAHWLVGLSAQGIA
jgi:hypothetical protein